MITELAIGKKDQHGLKQCKLKDLGPFVVLAGPNGGGKTRILNELMRLATPPEFSLGRSKIVEWSEDENRIIDDGNGAGLAVHEIGAHQPKLDASETKTEAAREEIYRKGENILARPVDPHRRMGDSEVFQFRRDVLSVMAHLADLEYDTHNNNTRLTQSEKKQVTDDFALLNSLLQSLVGTEIVRSKAGMIELFGRTVVPTELSDGQRILLQIAVLLYQSRSQIENTLLVYDEPENHLHPKALLEVVRGLRGLKPGCQLWVATHSPLIVAEALDASLFFVHDGRAEYVGNNPDPLVQGLMGDVRAISELVSLPSQWAATHYALECLVPPSSRDATGGDPQGLLAMEAVAGERVLDYGAGRARLLRAFAEAGRKVDYFAYDPAYKKADSVEAGRAEIELTSVYKEQWREHLLRDLPKDQVYDSVMLCNVLHEIPAIGWDRALRECAGLLREGGWCYIIEDMEMPKGELPHLGGFIVLGEDAAKKLFGTASVRVRHHEHAGNPKRLVCYEVDSCALSSVSRERVRETLVWIETTAKDDILKLRASKAVDANAARRHCHLMQLQLAASMALDGFNESDTDMMDLGDYCTRGFDKGTTSGIGPVVL